MIKKYNFSLEKNKPGRHITGLYVTKWDSQNHRWSPHAIESIFSSPKTLNFFVTSVWSQQMASHRNKLPEHLWFIFSNQRNHVRSDRESTVITTRVPSLKTCEWKAWLKTFSHVSLMLRRVRHTVEEIYAFMEMRCRTSGCHRKCSTSFIPAVHLSQLKKRAYNLLLTRTTEMNLGQAHRLIWRAPALEFWLEIAKSRMFVFQGFIWVTKF